MVYPAYYLLARLNLLQLVGIEDGELQFEGTKEAYSALDLEEDKILFGDKDDWFSDEGDRQDDNPNKND